MFFTKGRLKKYLVLMAVLTVNLINSNLLASKLSIAKDLDLKQLVQMSDLIVEARCESTTNRCRAAHQKFLRFKVLKVLKGESKSLTSIVDIVPIEDDLEARFKKAQEGPVKKSPVVSGFDSSVDFEKSFDKVLILFLRKSSGGDLHFAAPGGFEKLEFEKRVVEAIHAETKSVP